MLSKSAERIYWAGRYLERAENTARIVQQHTQLMLDLPAEVDVEWQDLIAIFGAKEDFSSAADGSSERVILRFLLADDNSGHSLTYCIRMARANIRNARDLLPTESWESVNELYQYARSHLDTIPDSESRFDVLSDCIAQCQSIIGILAGTLSRNSPAHFFSLGQSIERSDMTSRILDVAAAYLQQNENLVMRYGSTLWTNVLKSVSGFQMYRQYCQPEVTGRAVIQFLLYDEAFPRSLSACVNQAREAAAALPRAAELLARLGTVAATLPPTLPDDLDGAGVSALMDALQIRLAESHAAVVSTWFLPAR